MLRAMGDTMKVLILFVALLLGQVVAAADLFVRQQPRSFTLAEPLEAGATLGGYPVWQGNGPWQIVDIVRRDSSTGRVAIGETILFQVKNKKLHAVLTVAGTLGGESVRWGGEPCKRDDMLFKANIGRSIWEDNCFTLNHITSYMSNPGGKSAELYSLLQAQGIESPPTVLALTFTRNGTSGNFYSVTLKVNPEAFGFAREIEVNWGRNPWHKNMSFQDADKKQFIDALSRWGVEFANRLDAALAQKPNAFDGLPVLDSMLLALPRMPKTSTQTPQQNLNLN
jgi:hypothetical protein